MTDGHRYSTAVVTLEIYRHICATLSNSHCTILTCTVNTVALPSDKDQCFFYCSAATVVPAFNGTSVSENQ